MKLILGQTLSFIADPFAETPEMSALWDRRSGVVVDDTTGTIIEVGPADTLKRLWANADIEDHGDGLILPGFIDAHAHYPQTGIVASWGKRLIDWLNTYTFPEEARFGDPGYTAEVAARYFDIVLANGTTTTASFCTIHPESVGAYFAEAQKRGMRVVGGKTCMDRNAPDDLRDTAQSAYDDSQRLIARWHGQGRLTYAITPRFAPTSTPEQLEALGALWGEHPTCLMQTHLSEQTEEIEWVMGMYPEATDYTDIYDRFGLLGEGALMGHAIHLSQRERARLLEAGASLIHCPTSNTFIGSGLFDMAGLRAAGHRVGLATDTGGGSSFSMLRTMAAAYEVGQLRGTALHPAQLLWLATAGSAEALGMTGVIGTLAPDAEADLVVLDLASTPAIAQRADRAESIWEQLFPTLMMGDDRAVAATYVAGQRM
ncbi:guanine deaminase [Maritimibacter sp. UBA3975]|uniref:guanine deaminase n=1 Tax=Maritimibacter sp. UBA3975 TaxID=1946833 RepID=UPI000C0A1BD4|nr:guanine deaminase [Maritimibacter sp. UBA3975]MAM60409.1 guanine deaminase [Maritimibacter sp.]|tara:strand:- start:2821 stop:4107 length:1287 start_codon:yes stop_codon:yes gene_type:complete